MRPNVALSEALVGFFSFFVCQSRNLTPWFSLLFIERSRKCEMIMQKADMQPLLCCLRPDQRCKKIILFIFSLQIWSFYTRKHIYIFFFCQCSDSQGSFIDKRQTLHVAVWFKSLMSDWMCLLCDGALVLWTGTFTQHWIFSLQQVQNTQPNSDVPTGM